MLADYTMVPKITFLANLDLALTITDVPGCIVECGVWRGGMIAGIAEVLGPDRKYLLFDSFEGLPLVGEHDGQAAADWQRDTKSSSYYENCTAELGFSVQAMEIAGAMDYEIIKGWFKDTLPSFHFPSPIALLRLDADWYASTKVCLDCLFHKVATGGIIIIDDYFAWEGCRKAVHEFLHENQRVEPLHSDGKIGLCYMVKQ